MSTPDYMHAFDGGDWSYYVLRHDPDELHEIVKDARAVLGGRGS